MLRHYNQLGALRSQGDVPCSSRPTTGCNPAKQAAARPSPWRARQPAPRRGPHARALPAARWHGPRGNFAGVVAQLGRGPKADLTTSHRRSGGRRFSRARPPRTSLSRKQLTENKTEPALECSSARSKSQRTRAAALRLTRRRCSRFAEGWRDPLSSKSQRPDQRLLCSDRSMASTPAGKSRLPAVPDIVRHEFRIHIQPVAAPTDHASPLEAAQRAEATAGPIAGRADLETGIAVSATPTGRWLGRRRDGRSACSRSSAAAAWAW